MTTASVSGVVLAQSDETLMVEGNHYFPPDSVNWEYFTSTERTTGCPWKGTANYYSVTVDGNELSNVAWTYHDPKEAAKEIKDHVAFYPQVTVEETA
ncbi:MAG: DUF427 domain-containing protein [Acidimicrobiia bacterium]|nr:DUF427 domain-containing protein [Acidimicrobiia bacterium]